jgi:methylated-DNA-[protein]-cysteine S-methyltransferase
MTATRHAYIDSPLGPLLAFADGADRLCGLYMKNHTYGPSGQELPGRRDGGGVLKSLAEQLDAYFAGELQTFDIPLGAAGSEFQKRVWDALSTIGYGETRTYGEIAAQIGATGTHSARAVGAANGHNPMSIVVPCHRVIGANGALTGFGGGLENKRILLGLEARVAAGAPDLDEARCFAAMQARDRSADGTFVIGVRTTGVYCRPSCAGRPDRQNVVFLPDTESARRMGLRPCKRCVPDSAQVTLAI